MIKTFKENPQYFIGCEVVDSNTPDKLWTLTGIRRIGNNYMFFLYQPGIVTEVDIKYITPILIPMDKMTEADAVELIKTITSEEELQYVNAETVFVKKNLFGYYDKLRQMEVIFTYKRLSPEQFQFLLSRHYNVFNLPESEFIDAATLTPNPYL